MAPHSSILAWRTPWPEELVGCSAWSYKESGMTERLTVLLTCHDVHDIKAEAAIICSQD